MTKYYKCPACAWTKETPDDIVFVACNCCLTEMKEFPYQSKVGEKREHGNS